MRKKVLQRIMVAISFTWPLANVCAQQGVSGAPTTGISRIPEAATAPTAVPALVPYSGAALDGKGKPLTGEVSVTFLVYKDQQGGEPFFAESQSVTFDETGHYKVQLGAGNPDGLPADLFASGEARWLEVQVTGQPTEPRVLLASVPYALKAADSATLGGLPASAFVMAGSSTAIANAASATITPNAATSVTTAGGTANKVAKFSGTNTIVNSILYDNGTEVGIGTTAPDATLTVDGTVTVDGDSTYNGGVILNPTGKATASKPYDSQLLKMYASAYNSSTKAAVSPHFEWQVEPSGNDTSSPGAVLSLLATAASTGASDTGLYFNTNGTIHFAPGQTFPAINSTGTVEGSGGSNSSGVVGESSSSELNSGGVVGFNELPGGVGVLGLTAGGELSQTGVTYRTTYGYGAGVWGDSVPPNDGGISFGVMGTADDEYAGVFVNNSPSGYEALYAYNQASSEIEPAALFGGPHGNCTVNTEGDLACSGSKSAVVPVDNNTRQVALYAVESPENWFEDFGSGQLSNGVATVKLEPTFAQTVNLGVDYHVFLTPNGDSKGLYISRKTPTSFEVHESESGHSTIAFDYRIVARRKGYETIRLADKTKERDLSRLPLKRLAQQAKQTNQ